MYVSALVSCRTFSRRGYVSDSSLPLAKRSLHLPTNPSMSVSISTTIPCCSHLMTTSPTPTTLLTLHTRSEPSIFTLRTCCMPLNTWSTCPLSYPPKNTPTLSPKPSRRPPTALHLLPTSKNTLPFFKLVTQCLGGVRDLCNKAIQRISILPPARLAYRTAFRIATRLRQQFDQCATQAFPFNGFMFVRQDKIPDQLKLCSVRVLRRRMVRYLSDTANFTRLDEPDDYVLTYLSDFIFAFLRRCDHMGCVDIRLTRPST